MAEEIVKKEEVVEPKQEVSAPEYTAVERQAMARGWKPKDQWEGDPEDWRSAREHVERGEMIGKIIAQDRDLADLKKAVHFMTETQKKQYVAGYNKAIEETRAKRDIAVEEGDLKTVQEYNDKLSDLKEMAAESRRVVNTPPPQQQATGPSVGFQQWNNNNSWYGSDRVLTRYADAVGIAFKEDNPASSESQMLAYVEDEVKREFKNKFQANHAPNPEGSGRSSRQMPKNTNLSAAERNMSPEEKKIMETILKVTPKLTKEQYLKDYAE